MKNRDEGNKRTRYIGRDQAAAGATAHPREGYHASHLHHEWAPLAHLGRFTYRSMRNKTLSLEEVHFPFWIPSAFVTRKHNIYHMPIPFRWPCEVAHGAEAFLNAMRYRHSARGSVAALRAAYEAVKFQL